MYVAPWTIFSGLGALDRRDLCNLIASFETTTLLSMSIDRLSDLLSRIQKSGQSSDVTTFARRLKEAADTLFVSKLDTPALRIHLWAKIAEALTEILKILGAEPSKSQATGKLALQAWSTVKARLPFKS